jgi:3-hydroxybutyryl-CoA dehydrogenase
MSQQSLVANQIKTIAVIGTGTMGSGIAQLSAAAGYQTLMHDVAQGPLDKARKAIAGSFDKFVQKQKMTPDQREEALERLQVTVDLEGLSQADLVIEAVTERIEVKRELFGKLDKICPSHTILASNTSSLSITDMATATSRPHLVVGMHYFNPPALMKLVEVVCSPLTSKETFQTAWDVALKQGKTPVETRDTPGFIFNRLIIPYLNEAMWALYEGAGRISDIDAAMKLGGNMPIGPLALIDLIGIDVQLHACEALFKQFQDPKFRPCPLNRQMVLAGYLGRKVNKGFYDYSIDPANPIDLGPFKI